MHQLPFFPTEMPADVKQVEIYEGLAVLFNVMNKIKKGTLRWFRKVERMEGKK